MHFLIKYNYSTAEVKLQDPVDANGPGASEVDCMSKAAEAASNINAILIAQGSLKPSQHGGPHGSKKVLTSLCTISISIS